MKSRSALIRNIDLGSPHLEPVVMLTDAIPRLTSCLDLAIGNGVIEPDDGKLLRDQVPRAVVIRQRMRGTPEDFSFAALSAPRLSLEERRSMALRPSRRVPIPCDGGAIEILLDDFGEVNYLYVKRLPKVFSRLSGYLTTK